MPNIPLLAFVSVVGAGVVILWIGIKIKRSEAECFKSPRKLAIKSCLRLIANAEEATTVNGDSQALTRHERIRYEMDMHFFGVDDLDVKDDAHLAGIFHSAYIRHIAKVRVTNKTDPNLELMVQSARDFEKKWILPKQA